MNHHTLVFGDLLVVVDTNNQVIAHSFGLPERIGMAKVNHVITVHKNTKFNMLLEQKTLENNK